MLKKHKALLISIFILGLFSYVFAAEEKITVSTFYPSPGGVYNELKAVNFSVGSATGYLDNHAITDGYLLVSQRLGVQTSSPGQALEVADNQAIKLGAAYLSSGGNYAHLATNEWYNGSAWTGTAAGVLLQLNGATSAIVYSHNGAGSHTAWATVSSSAGWAAGSCSRASKDNIRKLTAADYVSLRKQFREMNLFSYTRKDVPGKEELGFIAEESPDYILEPDKSTVTLLRAIGYCAVVAKGQEEAISSLQEEVRALKSEINSLGSVK